jgi:type II secretory pathway pseudopilin PulG
MDNSIRLHHHRSWRRGFTAVELVMVIAVALAVVGAGSSAMLPSLRKAALNASLSSLEEACRTARQLAMAERDTAAEHYGVVCYRQGGQTWVAVTQGSAGDTVLPRSGDVLEDADGRPRYRQALSPSIGIFSGIDQASASILAEGESMGWFYQHRTGYLSATANLNIIPTFLGVTASELAAHGLLGGSSMLGALSLRSLDGRNVRVVQIYASGIMSAAEL